MNLLCLLAIVYQNGGGNIVACFVILHGVISALFFLVVDISYKIAGSRQTTSISGLSELAPKFVSVVWIALLAFRGLPLFAKFFVESDLLIILINTCTTTSAVLFLVATFIGVVSFFRA
jgi:NADH:ubiquinone oxidoreductase subunit 4 (subunit M)